MCQMVCDPMDCSPPGSSAHEILQARILEWVAISFSRGSSQPRDQTRVSCIAGGFFTDWGTREVLRAKIRSKYRQKDLPRWLSGKESTYNAGDLGLIPGSGRSPGEGNGNPLQYSCLENPTDRGAWRATVHGVRKGQTWLKQQARTRPRGSSSCLSVSVAPLHIC